MKRTTALLCFFIAAILSGFAQETGVVVGFQAFADDTVKKSAGILAAELQKSNIKNVVVKEIKSVNEATIILGRAQDLVKFGKKMLFTKKLAKLSSESVAISGNGKQTFLAGNSSLGVQQAVFRYLYILGYRYYFPQNTWHIYPRNANPLQVISYYSQPAFSHRRIWYAYGGGSDAVEARFDFWVKANCLGGEMQASVGHAYDVIVDRNKKEFLNNPQWLVNMTTPGVLPPNPKFDVSNRDLIDFVIRDTKKQIEKLKNAGSQAYKMISLSPSDDLGTCNTKDCQKLGSVTDRVFYLINAAARAVKKEYPFTKIGCLAYSEYIAPPSAPVEDNVYVSLTTAFNNSNYSIDELIDLWKRKTKHLGMYDYQALYAWDYDLPGQCMASAFHTIAPAISGYAAKGLTGYEAELNTGWVNKGLGYYITSRLLWNPNENTESIRREFFDNCFPNSAAEISQLYNEWSLFNDPFIGEAALSRWADLLLKAQEKEKDPNVLKRLADLAAYLQYIVLYNQYKANPGEGTLSALIGQARLNINNENLAYYPAMVVLGEKLNGFNINTVIRDNRAKAFEAPSVQQNLNWLRQFRQQQKTFRKYLPANPSVKLGPVPGAKNYTLGLHDVREDQNSYIGTTWFVFEKKAADTAWLELQADFIVGGGSRLPVKLSVYPFSGYHTPASGPIWQQSYTERKKWNRYSLATLKPGLYVLKVEDPKKGFQLKLSANINYSLFIPTGQRLEVGYIHSLYFYVPPGTASFRFMKSKTLRLIDPYGKEYNYANNKQEELEFYPTNAQSGIWRLMGVAEFFKPEGVHAVFGVIPSRMLYPQ